MPATTAQTISVVGIDIGKNSFHIVGLNNPGAIMLRQKWSRGQVEARFANLPPCLIGMVACVGAHHPLARARPSLRDVIFAAWLGLVPKQISTGDRTILGKISKRGNRYLRTLFVQAAWVVLMKIKSTRWGIHALKDWIEAAKKRLHHNVLAIALANKLARIAWSVLPRGRAFETSKLQPI